MHQKLPTNFFEKVISLDFLTALFSGYLLFIVGITRISFLAHSVITPITLIVATISYFFLVVFLYLFGVLSFLSGKKDAYDFFSTTLLAFFSMCLVFISSSFFAKTYDSSWDGQGYSQTAIIALANGWNPVYQSAINLGRRTPNQIFSEGYPTALWEIQAAIYAATGKINAAKVTSLYIGILAFIASYAALRKLSVNRAVSALIGSLLVLQPIYINQFFTFMQDGFCYALLIIAIASLLAFIKQMDEYFSVITFLSSEILLVSTKYSNLPAALLLGSIFFIVLGNRFLNRDYLFSFKTLIAGFVITALALLFATVPYVRNLYYHHALFYPTNIPDLMGAVDYNNIPMNLRETSKLNLLIYGIFSSSQTNKSGDPTNQENNANLKLPFTFSINEVQDSVGLFNNRVGAGGPLFSGIFLVAISALFAFSYVAKSKHTRYVMYAAFFSLSLFMLLAIFVPTPNLLRYSTQLQLVPFVTILSLMLGFKNKFAQFVAGLLLLGVAINSSLYGSIFINHTLKTTNKIKQQLSEMQQSGHQYQVVAHDHFSNYILLQENNIAFTAVETLTCENEQYLVVSDKSTSFCSNLP